MRVTVNGVEIPDTDRLAICIEVNPAGETLGPVTVKILNGKLRIVGDETQECALKIQYEHGLDLVGFGSGPLVSGVLPDSSKRTALEKEHDFIGGVRCQRCGISLRAIAVQRTQPGSKGFSPMCLPPLMGPAGIGQTDEMTLRATEEVDD